MSDVITVLQSTFERYARLKALYVILVICILDVAAMGLYDELTMGRAEELMFDASLAILTIVGLLTAMTAAFDIPRELREKTAQFILTKPMGRSAFIWGKFLGIGLLCIFNIAIITIGSAFVIHSKYGVLDMGLFSAAVLIAGEALVLTGAGIFFSMFLSDSIAAIGVFLTYVVGHIVFLLPRASEGAGFLARVLPNFHHLNIKTEMSVDIELADAFVWYGVVYALCYALVFVGLSAVIFSRKDVS